MTVGEGIFYSTVLLVIAGFFYFISINSKWKIVAKIIGGLVLLGLVIGGGFWAYDSYENRLLPKEELIAVTGYMGIELGAPRVEVTLAHGLPESESENTRNDVRSIILNYDGFAVWLTSLEPEVIPNTVYRVCTLRNQLYSTDHEILGINHSSSEETVRDQFGLTSSESISKDGTERLLNYKDLNITFQLTAREVSLICMSVSEMSFVEEYGATDAKVSN